jgi:TPR repeat protein
MYADGRGVAKDERQAVAWFTRAAEQGLADAQNNLGVMYENGKGVAKDERQAASWYAKAARQGFGMAQRYLALLLRDGRGVDADQVAAYAWMNLASAAEDAPPRAAEDREKFALVMTRAQINEAQRLSREWVVGRDLGPSRLPKAVAAVRANAIPRKP